jgi:hypothetical protein
MGKIEHLCYPNLGLFAYVLTAYLERAMAENKTVPNDQNVEQFLNTIEDERKRKDAFTIVKLMQQITGMEPKMWGSSIVGFGSYHYKYDSGREGDSALAGFSPRKQNLTIYNMGGFERYDGLLKKLGKHTTGKGCLYIKRLDDIDLPTLKRLIEESVKNVKQRAHIE